mgnify:CR=1 FL=1
MYLGLTGDRVFCDDALFLGLATHVVDADYLDALEVGLAKLDLSNGLSNEDMDAFLQQFASCAHEKKVLSHSHSVFRIVDHSTCELLLEHFHGRLVLILCGLFVSTGVYLALAQGFLVLFWQVGPIERDAALIADIFSRASVEEIVEASKGTPFIDSLLPRCPMSMLVRGFVENHDVVCVWRALTMTLSLFPSLWFTRWPSRPRRGCLREISACRIPLRWSTSLQST